MSETTGAQIAYGNALDEGPDWQNLTRVSGWEIRRGRTDEFQRTSTGTATIFVNDLTGYLGSGADYPVHARINLRGSPMFRGHVDNVSVQVESSGAVSRVAIECVDAFDLLAGIEVAPSTPVTFGASVPEMSLGNVFYEADQVDDRIILALDDAGWPGGLRDIFSGNVTVQDTVYAAGSSILQIINDAADAEFPTVANLFIGARNPGAVTFRGRFARFNPGAYGISEWQAGTMGNVTTGVAQIRVLEYETTKKQVFNSALCYPDPNRHSPLGVKTPVVMEDQLMTDTASISKWGVRSWSAENLLTLRHNDNGNTGAEECQLFAQYVVENYADPVPRVSRIGLKALRDTDARAAATWAMMQGAEIGDTVQLTTDWISGSYFIEGITARARELDGTIPYAEVEYDLSPAANWTVSPF